MSWASGEALFFPGDLIMKALKVGPQFMGYTAGKDYSREEAIRTRVKVDKKGQPVLDENGEKVLVTETYFIRRYHPRPYRGLIPNSRPRPAFNNQHNLRVQGANAIDPKTGKPKLRLTSR